MRTYIKRLRAHRGVPVAAAYTFCLWFPALLIPTAKIGMSISAVASMIIWMIVLVTARTQPLPREEHRDD